MAEGQWVDIFVSGHNGYGDSRRQRRQFGYNRVSGSIDARTPGEITPGADNTKVLATHTAAGVPVYVGSWEDTSGNPVVIYCYDDIIKALARGGVLAATNILGVPLITSACMHDDGSGVPYLYVARGAPAGGTNKVNRRDRAATVTTCANLVADKLLSLNNNLYITATPSGGTATCGVGKVAAGSNPATVAQPALTVVGMASSPINNIVADGDGRAPVCLKPEGIFGFDRALGLWRAIGRIQHHPDNGKAYWYEQGDLCVALGAGGVVRVHAAVLMPWSPFDGATPDTSTTTQHIAAGTSFGDGALLVTKAGTKAQRSGGSSYIPAVFFKKTIDNGATFTDYSSAVSDGQDGTYADLSSLGTLAAGDWFVVGHRQPFVGVEFDMLAPNANLSLAAVQYRLADGTWVDVESVDLTSAGDQFLRQSGWVFLWNADETDMVADGGWALSSFSGPLNYQYWLRFSVSATLGATVRVRGVRLLPWRRGINTRDGGDRAGLFPHLLHSMTDETGQHVVHDLGAAMPDPDAVGVCAWLPYDTASTNGEANALIIVSQNGIHYRSVLAQSSDAVWPIVSDGLIEFPSIALDAPARLAELVVEGRSWGTAGASAAGRVYYHYDDGRAWSYAGQFSGLPWRTSVVPDGGGTTLKVCLVIFQGDKFAGAPTVTRIRARMEPVARAAVHLPAQIPPVV